MPSEAVDQRLHPASIAFWLGRQVRRMVVPMLVGGVSAGSIGLGWQTMVGIILTPAIAYSVIRYMTFRYRLEDTELVVRSGLIFRQVRTIPYRRIQNLDATQGVLQRALDVVEVQIQTGSGTEPEATMSVIPSAAVPALRRRVFEGRGELDPGEVSSRPPTLTGADNVAELATLDPTGGSGPGTGGAMDAPHAEGAVLLHLPPKELLIYGLIQNRGMIVIAAGMGLAWELGLVENFASGAIGNSAWFQGLFSEAIGAAGVTAAITAISLLTAAVVGLLIFARMLSMAWAFVRLHDFTISKSGEDLRTTFGLLTRVSATIPLRRIQKLTIHQSPLHRLAGRAAVRVETAGGSRYEQTEEAHRQWLAPIIRHERLPAFVHEVLPELDYEAVHWERVADGARGRVFKEAAAVATLFSAPLFFVLGFGGLITYSLALGWAWLYATTYVAHLGWTVTNGAVLFKSGWLWRRISVARFAKIQTVSVRQTPFDRRRRMARLRVDTAGAGSGSHGVHIPYLPDGRAWELNEALTAEAARTAFKW
ncbi:MAG: PH domain-containing protein [Gemmatimonadota bacterium]|nr:PH domain-containing protein [Gemmatimonadota bacterium]